MSTEKHYFIEEKNQGKIRRACSWILVRANKTRRLAKSCQAAGKNVGIRTTSPKSPRIQKDESDDSANSPTTTADNLTAHQ